MGGSILSGGKYVYVYHSVALHDATLFHSSFYDHCTSLLSYLLSTIIWDFLSCQRRRT